MHKKTLKILPTIFGLIGLALVVAALVASFVAYTNPARRHGVPTTAVITGFSRARDVTRTYIQYTFEGQVFDAHLGYFSTGMRIGDQRQILVNPNDPTHLVSAGVIGYLAPIILGAVGLPFLGVGLGFLLSFKKEARKRDYLFSAGVAIMADVVGVEKDWRVTINGRPGKMLVATYGNQEFRSGLVDNNDLANLGDKVKILLDPQDHASYVFDFHNESIALPTDWPLGGGF